MENTQLINILKTLDKNEFRELGKFVRSPFFNNRSEIIRFYDALKEFYPDFKSKLTSEEIIFKKVYPGKKYSSVLMRKLNSLMTNLLMEYFGVAGSKENELEYNIRIIDKLREKKLNILFEKRAKIIDGLFNEHKHTFDLYESKFKYTSIVNGHLLNKNESSMVNRLQNEIDEFTEYFLSVALLFYVRLSEWSRGYNIKFDLKFYDEVLNYLSLHDYKDVPLVYLYYNMLMLLNTGEEKYFNDLFEGRNKFENKLCQMDDYNISIVMIQYCFKRVQKGEVEYRKKQFEITKLIIEKKIIPPGFMEPYFFTNTVRNAAYIKEFKWSTDFIAGYKQRLNPEYAEDIANYSLAVIEFYKGRYEQSLRYISTINPDRSFMKVDIKNISLVVYYELDYIDELTSLIDSYKHFLSRDKEASGISKDASSKLIKYVSALLKIRLNGKYEEAVLLKKEIEKNPYFNLKEWLVQKAEELINK